MPSGHRPTAKVYGFWVWSGLCCAGAAIAAIAGRYTLIVLAAVVFVAPLLILGRMWRQTHQRMGGFRNWLRS
ncbi:hypothetical protein ACFOYW_00005 [Gryllotalpicola reticulitermitis]|uniref:Uncharacterized protein n=1 Tax=Gryllotalpicola reticulitermitis TaxID=1184153 RepID=A0ABV8Q2X2_9MICO